MINIVQGILAGPAVPLAKIVLIIGLPKIRIFTKIKSKTVMSLNFLSFTFLTSSALELKIKFSVYKMSKLGQFHLFVKYYIGSWGLYPLMHLSLKGFLFMEKLKYEMFNYTYVGGGPL